jgi:hypothetical protein
MNRPARRPEGAARAGRAALITALLIAVPAGPAAAQGAQSSKAAREEASNRFRKGIELFKDGDYQAALIEFRRAYELVPSYAVLYNIGQVQFQIQDYASALATFERYLAEGGRQIAASRRAEVEKDIQKLKTRIAQLDISINVPDAELAIDDVPFARGPFVKPLTVSAGRHKLTASRDGYFSTSKVVDLASNDTVKVTLELIERNSPQTAPPVDGSRMQPQEDRPTEPARTSEPSPAGLPRPSEQPRGSFPWVGWVVTGTFAAGAATFGVLALNASSVLEQKRESFLIDHDDLERDSRKTTAFAITCDALTGAAVIAGGVSLYFTVRSLSPASTDAAASRARAVRVGVGPTGVWVSGAF